MTMGNAAQSASIEDPRQPEWMKHKSLREIETIRETNKANILNQLFGVDTDNADYTLSVTPGQIKFLPIPIMNQGDQKAVFSVKFEDPDLDINILGGKDFAEFKLVTESSEFTKWVSHGKVMRPKNFDSITLGGDVMLEPNQKMDLLVKFLTTREVSFSKNILPSSYVIKPRKVKIYIMSGGINKQSIEVNVVPTIAPVDHIFRFYEPEQSHFQIILPPFIKFNQAGIQVVISDPEATADVMGDTSHIVISGKTEEAMIMNPMTLFVFGDEHKSVLLATCRIEIHSRPVIYSKVKKGHKSQHTLMLPSERARTVRVCSNKPSEVKWTGSHAGALRLIPNSLNPINVEVLIDKAQRAAAPTLVNCVDQDNGELVYSWLLILEVV